MLVYVIRHGQSQSNLRKQWTGWLDAPLTEEGRTHAEKVGAYLQGIDFDRVYASDLVRARDTAAIALPHAAVITTPLLREINVGTLAGQPLSAGNAEQCHQLDYSAFGGETEEGFFRRITAMKEELSALPCQKVALFSHAGWLRGMLDSVLGLHLPMEHIRCDNGTIAVFACTDGQWQLHSWINL